MTFYTTEQISFGTSGHRGLIGSSFTQDHVYTVASAVGRYLHAHLLPHKVIIGYDPRQGNDPHLSPGSFTQAAVQGLWDQGIEVYFCTDFCPTPVISWAIGHFHLGGGLILTASHNPPEYNGIKFNPGNGAPAPREVTEEIEKLTKDGKGEVWNGDKPFQYVWPVTEFAIALVGLVGTFFDKSPTTDFIVDAKHGSVATTWEAIATQLGINITLINEAPNPKFGICNPNPTTLSGLLQLKDTQHRLKASMGIANDPDGDRHIILDEAGTPLTPEETTLIIAQALLDSGHPLKGLISTLASSATLSIFCKKNKLTFIETEVGFKYIAPHLEIAQANHTLMLGVESSGGFSMTGHTLEKCGFIPGVLLAYILANSPLTLSEWKTRIHTLYGKRTFIETSLPQQIDLTLFTDQKLSSIFQGIQRIDRRDGLKLCFSDHDWLLIRPSGTEPVSRLYCESHSPQLAQSRIKSLQF